MKHINGQTPSPQQTSLMAALDVASLQRELDDLRKERFEVGVAHAGLKPSVRLLSCDHRLAIQARERLNAARFGPPGGPGRPGEGPPANRTMAPPGGPGLRPGPWDRHGSRQGTREPAGGRGFGDARGPPPLHGGGPGPRSSVFARLSSGMPAPLDRGPEPRRMGSGGMGDDRPGSSSLDRRRSSQVCNGQGGRPWIALGWLH